MSTHNICISREIRKILCGYPLLSVAMIDIFLVSSLKHLDTQKHSTCLYGKLKKKIVLHLLSRAVIYRLVLLRNSLPNWAASREKVPWVRQMCGIASSCTLDAPSDWRPGGRGFNPRRGRQHSFVEIDHEIFSTVILSLPLIQEGQLPVSGERMCTLLVNRLED